MICDRIVVGILDKSLAERLQLDAALTLDGCIKLVRGTDVAKKLQKLLAAHANNFAIAGIQNSSKARASPNNYNQVCNWCGAARQSTCPKILSSTKSYFLQLWQNWSLQKSLSQQKRKTGNGVW